MAFFDQKLHAVISVNDTLKVAVQCDFRNKASGLKTVVIYLGIFIGTVTLVALRPSASATEDLARVLQYESMSHPA